MRKVVGEFGKVFEAEFRSSEPQLTPAAGWDLRKGSVLEVTDWVGASPPGLDDWLEPGF